MGFFSGLGDIVKNVGNFLNPISPLISAGSSLLGGIIGSETDKDINQQQIDLSKESWAWQERMANTAHQREVADLRKAGLNPILSAKLSGSATPPISTPTLHAPGKLLAEGASSASLRFLEGMNIRQNIATSKSQERANSALAIKTASEAQRQMYENDALAMEVERRKQRARRDIDVEKFKSDRSWWYRGLGVSRDVIDSLNPLRGMFQIGN